MIKDIDNLFSSPNFKVANKTSMEVNAIQGWIVNLLAVIEQAKRN